MSTYTLIAELEKLQPIQLDSGKVFSNKTSGNKIWGFGEKSFFTPSANLHYCVNPTGPAREIIVWFCSDSPDPLYVYGPTGSGKTSLVKHIASMLNYPVFETTGHARLEFPDLVGHLSVQDGNMIFQYGPLALAMKYGCLFILNEGDLLDPATAAGLNSVLDGAPLCIPENGGELIMPHAMFRFCMTANTNGGSDQTGLYQGTLRQNLAFMDRFWLCEVDYPAPEIEESILEREYPSIPKTIRSQLISYANEVRSIFRGENGEMETIEVTMSTRTLIRWAELISKFQPLSRAQINPVEFALERALLMRASPTTRVALREIAQRIFA